MRKNTSYFQSEDNFIKNATFHFNLIRINIIKNFIPIFIKLKEEK